MKPTNIKFQIWTDDIYIIPTIELHLNNMIYSKRNFAIIFHWLVFHGRLFWCKEGESE